jgi:U3 small nucleolar RNA-associated protein 3
MPYVLDAKTDLKLDKFLQPSDEEVLDAGSDDDDDDEDDDDDDTGDESEDDITGQRKPADEDEEEDVGGWGASKKDYYDADAIETEQDALDEEAEARRIQKKQLQSMTREDEDYADTIPRVRAHFERIPEATAAT